MPRSAERRRTGAASGPGAAFAPLVVRWQRRHGRRGLPWQGSTDPYRVWLSEIMLQQTQVAAVVGYYTRFVERFGDVHALAAAPLADVLAAWSGLGYYARARHLHRCAQVVVQQHGGRFPRSAEELAALPGIGRSTAAAIAAFCHGERVAILDGNVKRVLARVLAFDGDLAEAGPTRRLWDAATALLPPSGIAAYTQGLMDLGATVCLARNPRCGDCPVAALCGARAAGDPARYPVKTRKLRRSRRDTVWLRLAHRDRTFLVERPPRGVWAGLWSLPEFDGAAAFEVASARWPGAAKPMPAFLHVLTHRDWWLHPVCWDLPARTSAARVAALTSAWPSGRWFTRGDALALGLPAPLRRWLEGDSPAKA